MALSLEGASAYPHFDRVAFRIPQRTFATLALDGSDLNLLFDLAHQAEFCELAPLAIAPVTGGWGRMGWTRIDLKQIDAATFTLALKAAHARASAPRTRKGAVSKGDGTKSDSRNKAPAKKRLGKKVPPKLGTSARRPKKSR